MILKSLKRVLKNLGYELILSKITANEKLLQKGAPLRIEFIGPPGVGKTTLSNFFIDYFQNDNSIISRQKLIKNIQKKIEINRIYQKILDDKFKNVAKFSILPQTKIKLINYFEKVIEIEVYSQYIGNNKLLVIDEGIFHNFAQELIERDNFQELANLFKDRLICFCYAPEKDILQNLTLNNRYAEQLPGYSLHSSYEDKLFFIKYQYEIMAQLQDFLKKHDIPFIKINLEMNNLEDNSKKIRDKFLQFFSFQI